MIRTIAAVIMLLVLLTDPVRAQQYIWETNASISKTVGSVRLQLHREYRSYGYPGQFVASAVVAGGGVRGDFQGVCAESLSVDLTVTDSAPYDKDAYRQSRSGGDLPIAEALHVMKDALVEQCGQVQVIRVRAKSDQRVDDHIDYKGTMTRSDHWRLADGFASTAYDGSHWFILAYRDRDSVIGVYNGGVCEEEPLLLLEPYPDAEERAEGYAVNFATYTEVAKSVAERYAEDCPRTHRVQYILAPFPQDYWCVTGKTRGDECFIVANRNPETHVWEIDRSQIEFIEYREPIVTVEDMAEVLAAGEFRILQDYREYFAFCFESFINAYSTHCRSHIQEPVDWTYAAIDGVRFRDSHGNVTSEIEGWPEYTIVIEARYKRALDRYADSSLVWATQNMSPLTFASRGQQIHQSVASNCTDDRIQTIYQNMYNVAYSEPAIKGRYTTDKKPLFIRPAHISSAPARTEAIHAEWKARVQGNQRRAKTLSNLPISSSPADTVPEAQEPSIRRRTTGVDVDYVISNMARTAGRLQATAEQCTGKPESEIRSMFVEAGSQMFPQQITAIEQAFEQHYEKRKASLEGRRKNRCREKDYRRWTKENEFNLDLLAGDGNR